MNEVRNIITYGMELQISQRISIKGYDVDTAGKNTCKITEYIQNS